MSRSAVDIVNVSDSAALLGLEASEGESFE